MKLNLVPENSQILRQKIESDFDFLRPNEDPGELIWAMANLMFEKNGIGLASPQVGLSHRLFIIGEIDNATAYFNPKILEFSEEKVRIEEGCLSFPGLYINIVRPETVVVEYQDKAGKVKNEELTGIWSRCFQHELDHLNGVLFMSRASRTALSLSQSRRKKVLRRMSK